jgi:hypothetical protein
MMQGPWTAKQFVNEYLQEDLKERLIEYRNHWNLSESELPMPTIFHAFEPASLLDGTDDFPVCYTVILTTRSLERVDYEHNLDPHYRVTYQTRTYVWAEGESESEATRTRDNLLTVVRTALLDHQCLTRSDQHAREVRIDEGSIQEEYSDIEYNKMQMWLAGAYLGYNITLNEIVTRKPIGTVGDIRVEGSILPRYLLED